MSLSFLVDAQLPPALARWLAQQGFTADHVHALGLASAPEREIWNYATRCGFIIVTKDEDFASLRAMSQDGPADVWLRTGNATTKAPIERLAPLLPAVELSLRSGERLIEIL